MTRLVSRSSTMSIHLIEHKLGELGLVPKSTPAVLVLAEVVEPRGCLRGGVDQPGRSERR